MSTPAQPARDSGPGPGRPRLLYGLLLILAALVFSPLAPAMAGDDPFAGPANWGGTGLLEIPTARILPEGRFRVGVGQADPYRYYFGAIGILPGVEIDGRVTEILGISVPGMPDYGNYKDKAVDLKWQFLAESKWLPALAVGFMDPHGTRLFASQYLAASKQIYPFDFTIGYGNGRFGSQPLASSGDSFRLEMVTDPGSWQREGRFFGGIQFAVTRQLTLMVEYSPIAYERQTSDPAQARYFQTGVPSRFNYGLRFKPWDWLEVDLSYQRGNQLAGSVSMAFELGNPLIPIFDLPYREKPENFPAPLERRVTQAMADSGFSDIAVKVTGDELWIEAANRKYLYTMKAVGTALRAIHGILRNKAGGEIQRIRLTVTQNGIPVLEFATAVEDLNEFEAERFKIDEFVSLAEIRTDIRKPVDAMKTHRQYLDYALKPDFKLFLNDPSGFLNFRLGVAGDLLLTPWPGSTFAAGVVGYPVNTVSTANAPSATPVRTDVVSYQERSVLLGRLLMEQIGKFDHGLYGRVGVGLLEEQYAGVDWEIAGPLRNGRFIAGFSGSAVKKRDPGSVFEFKQDDWKDHYLTGFFNLRLNIPELEVNVDLKTGQFLAGDRGAMVTVSKNFNGVVLSAWYGVTDTGIFPDSYNRGYHNKGVSIAVPLEMFSGRHSRTVYKTGIAPWTRDVAQDIDHFDTLFDFIGRNAGVYVQKDSRLIQ